MYSFKHLTILLIIYMWNLKFIILKLYFKITLITIYNINSNFKLQIIFKIQTFDMKNDYGLWHIKYGIV